MICRFPLPSMFAKIAAGMEPKDPLPWAEGEMRKVSG
jgi:hypothetical protein